MIKKFGSHNMTVLYPSLCYNDVWNKGTTLYIETVFISFQKWVKIQGHIFGIFEKLLLQDIHL